MRTTPRVSQELATGIAYSAALQQTYANLDMYVCMCVCGYSKSADTVETEQGHTNKHTLMHTRESGMR